MCHSDRVAQSHYLSDDLTAVGAEAINIIALCTGQEETSQQPQPSTSARQQQQPHDEDKGEGAESPNEESLNRPLTQAEKETIRTVFHKEIVEDTPVQSKDLRPKMMTVVALRKLIPYKRMVKKVADCPLPSTTGAQKRAGGAPRNLKPQQNFCLG